MPGFVPSVGVLMTKLVSLVPHNAGTALPTHQAVIVAFDPQTGHSEASGRHRDHRHPHRRVLGPLSARLLARPDAHVPAILGTGVQAGSHAHAMCRVRPITEIRVASRSPDEAAALTAELAASLAVTVRAVADYAVALAGADIACATTHSVEPVIRREWLDPGTHVTSALRAVQGAGSAHTSGVDHDSAVGARTQHWDEVYSARGEQGVSWFAEQPRVSLELLDAAGVEPRCSVIDVGAGASRLVDALLERGHREVSVLDVSEQGLAVARARLGPAAPQARWIVADLLDWQPERRFEVWHDRAVFHFLTDPAERARYVAVLGTALARDGVLVIGTFADDGPRACSGLPTARYSPEQLLTVLGGQARWEELGRRREHHSTPAGVDQVFTWLALRRRAARVGECADDPAAQHRAPRPALA